MITSADYLLIDTVYAQSHALAPDFLARRQSQFGPAYVQSLLTSLPEPSSLLLSITALISLTSRRHRRHA